VPHNFSSHRGDKAACFRARLRLATQAPSIP
jgi:hypothetical protein